MWLHTLHTLIDVVAYPAASGLWEVHFLQRRRVGHAPTWRCICTDVVLGMHRRYVGYAPTLCWVCTDIDLDRWAVENAS